jgi:hypothetical protein
MCWRKETKWSLFLPSTAGRRDRRGDVANWLQPNPPAVVSRSPTAFQLCGCHPRTKHSPFQRGLVGCRVFSNSQLQKKKKKTQSGVRGLLVCSRTLCEQVVVQLPDAFYVIASYLLGKGWRCV